MKKGVFELGLTVLIFIALVITLIGYYILFVFIGGILDAKQIQVIEGDEMNSMSFALTNLLRTPVELDGNVISVSDLIVYSYNNEDYSTLEAKLNELFLNTNLTWYMQIIGVNEGSKQKSMILYKEGFLYNEGKFTFTSQKLPNLNGGEIIVNFVITEKSQ